MFFFQGTTHPNASRSAQRQRQRQSQEHAELLQSIARAKLELEVATQNFSYVTDPLLVDVYTYQIKAAQAKYRYLLQKARTLNITQEDYTKEPYPGRTAQL